MVRVHVGLTRDMYDFDLGIADKYNLSQCQQSDREAARQYAKNFRKQKSCERRPEYLNKLALKRMAKCALAQRNYAIMLFSTPDELESMFDVQEHNKQQVLQNEHIPIP